jgi:Skp family chaperone for outer membrane proteins
MKKEVLIIALTAAACVVIAFAAYIWVLPKTAYVEVSELYNTFEMKKEMEVKFQKTQKERERILDSMKVELNALSRSIELSDKKNAADITEFYKKRENLELKQEQFDADTEAMAEEFKSQIWKRLDQYIEEYGKSKNYDYLYGVDDSYHKKGNDITEDLKKYLQEKYKGK